MDILYFGIACGEEFEKQVTSRVKSPYTIAQNNLEKALLAGFLSNGLDNITLNCLPSLNYAILGNRLYYKKKNIEVNETLSTQTYTVVKIAFFKYLVYFFSTIYRLFKWIIKKRKVEKIVFVAVNFPPVTLPLLVLSKLFKIKVVCLFCDLSEDMYSSKRSESFSTFKKLSLPFYLSIIKYIEQGYDGYVFLTEQMNKINKNRKPYVVMEGIFNNNFSESVKIRDNTDIKKFKIVYSGSLYEIYGIKKILDVFELLNKEIFELHIYGDGEYREEVIQRGKECESIYYHGFVDRQKLFSELCDGDLLINLRDPNYEYTKYSFPSKLFEYMASTTPVLITRLEGIPNEYYNYCFDVNTYDSLEIKDKIEVVSNLTFEERNLIGTKARKFILENKSSKVQSSNIMKFLKTL